MNSTLRNLLSFLLRGFRTPRFSLLDSSLSSSYPAASSVARILLSSPNRPLPDKTLLVLAGPLPTLFSLHPLSLNVRSASNPKYSLILPLSLSPDRLSAALDIPLPQPSLPVGPLAVILDYPDEPRRTLLLSDNATLSRNTTLSLSLPSLIH